MIKRELREPVAKFDIIPPYLIIQRGDCNCAPIFLGRGKKMKISVCLKYTALMGEKF